MPVYLWLTAGPNPEEATPLLCEGDSGAVASALFALIQHHRLRLARPAVATTAPPNTDQKSTDTV